MLQIHTPFCVYPVLYVLFFQSLEQLLAMKVVCSICFFCRAGTNVLVHLGGLSGNYQEALSLMLCLGYPENQATCPTPLFSIQKIRRKGQDQNFHHLGTSWTPEAHSSRTENVLVNITQLPCFTKLLDFPTPPETALSASIKEPWLLPLRQKFPHLITIDLTKPHRV